MLHHMFVTLNSLLIVREPLDDEAECDVHPESTFNYQLHDTLSTVEHNKYLGTVTVQPTCALIIIIIN